MPESKRWSLFEAFGIELEYMLVDHQSLDVRSVADRVLETAAGHPISDVEFGAATWSNELALHVLELKGTEPTADLLGLSQSLQQALVAMQPILQTHDALLLPGAMHPWMDPSSEAKLWPHECAEIYQAYHRLFNCLSHGWANVQSVHLNLPFSSDEEFSKLHAAVRLILPILPALTASSPIVQSTRSEWLDMRMRFVRDHCREVPFLTGDMVPEAIFDEATYRREIFSRLQEAIGPHDPEGVFDANFLNARGAIARFDRGSIEIRVMDVQEYPAADVAICAAVVGVLKSLVAQRWHPLQDQQRAPTGMLSKWLDRVSQDAQDTVIDETAYLRLFGVTDPAITAGDLWRHLSDALGNQEPMVPELRRPLETVLRHGTLANRIIRAVGEDYRREHLRGVYRELNACLTDGNPFLPS